MPWKRVALFAIVTATCAAPSASPKNSRIALRYTSGKVLIVGGEISIADEAAAKALSAIYDKYPKLKGADMVGGASMSAVPPQLLQTYKLEPRTDWHTGDQWQLYPGAGPPATVVIETVVMLNHPGCDCFRDGAIARFLDPATANRIEGLRAGEFLAAPASGIVNVSQTPLIPLGQQGENEQEIRKVLFNRAHEIVKDENWGMEDNPNVPQEEKDRVRELNRRFLSTPEYGIRISAMRWTLPGAKPLLFALAVWYTEVDAKQVPVFAAEAILEEGDSLKLLSFDYREGEWMRFREFANWTWDFDFLARFLNAWKIGNRYFVLRFLTGYESSGVALQELDFKQGLLPTDLAFAFGA